MPMPVLKPQTRCNSVAFGTKRRLRIKASIGRRKLLNTVPAACLSKITMGNNITRLENNDRSLQEGCIFCDIVKGDGTQKVYEDDLLTAFKDISPAAVHHLLVIPKAHIVSTHHLQATDHDRKLVVAMLEVGKRLIHELDPSAQTKYGFHDPPFLSVPHLHLHCFALPHVPAWKGFSFIPTKTGWLGFVSVDQVLARLQTKQQSAR